MCTFGSEDLVCIFNSKKGISNLAFISNTGVIWRIDEIFVVVQTIFFFFLFFFFFFSDF